MKGDFVYMLLVSAAIFILLLTVFELKDSQRKLKQRALDSGHAIYHPETGKFIFKGEIDEEK